MAVSRENAIIGESIELRLLIRNKHGCLVDALVGPVNIFDDDTGVLLETVASPERVEQGVYRIFTDPAWNVQRRRVRDEWTVLPEGADAPVTIIETFLILDAGECENLDHIDDGTPVLVGSSVRTGENNIFELRVTERCLNDNVPKGTPVACLGDRLLDARQRAEQCATLASFDPAFDPTLEIHPHTPWFNALVRIFSIVPSTKIRRMWLHDRTCIPINDVSTPVMIFRYRECSFR